MKALHLACLAALAISVSAVACPTASGTPSTSHLIGGYGAPKAADDQVAQVLKDTDGWQTAVVKKRQALGENIAGMGDYKICSYQTQVVAGINYDVTIAPANSASVVHVKIYQPLPHTRQSPGLQSVSLD
eukprot:TRINITY_DN972_c0_g1_i1.p1 TRINITY_DN972_c0_g1~~TRINITY_DN972_c0_g1_i1.p1  ORF type:complete len:130 (-),score=22.26 TRINITY_DN972_c0_g1_i1:342-731(-)